MGRGAVSKVPGFLVLMCKVVDAGWIGGNNTRANRVYWVVVVQKLSKMKIAMLKKGI